MSRLLLTMSANVVVVLLASPKECSFKVCRLKGPETKLGKETASRAGGGQFGKRGCSSFTFQQLNYFHILQIAPLRTVAVPTQIYCAMTADKQIL